MSARKYHYGSHSARRRPRKALVVLVSFLLLVGLIGAIIYMDLRKHADSGVEGESRTVGQALDGGLQPTVIDEPNYYLELPGEWKETGRNTNIFYTSISWQSMQKGEENRYLTLYTDRIPTDLPFNRLVALKAQGTGLSFSDVSDNCASFTVGGTFNTGLAVKLKPTITKWDKVDFMCNLPRVTDNEVGTGSEGMANAVSVTGPTKGVHTYFFLYTDRTFQPQYNIFYDVLRSFKAK